jgi:hypothetical protein
MAVFNRMLGREPKGPLHKRLLHHLSDRDARSRGAAGDDTGEGRIGVAHVLVRLRPWSAAVHPDRMTTSRTASRMLE